MCRTPRTPKLTILRIELELVEFGLIGNGLSKFAIRKKGRVRFGHGWTWFANGIPVAWSCIGIRCLGPLLVGGIIILLSFWWALVVRRSNWFFCWDLEQSTPINVEQLPIEAQPYPFALSYEIWLSLNISVFILILFTIHIKVRIKLQKLCPNGFELNKQKHSALRITK